MPTKKNIKLQLRSKKENKKEIGDVPLEKGPDFLGAAVDLGLDVSQRAQLANLLEINLILAERILLQGVNVDFAESHAVLFVGWLFVGVGCCVGVC